MNMPLEAKVGLALLIGLSLVLAAVVKPPRQPRPGVTGLVLGASLTAYVAAAILLLSHETATGVFALVAATEGMCLTAWLGRGILDGGSGPGSDDREPPASHGGPDGGSSLMPNWSDFESLRRSWSRDRQAGPTGSDD